MRATIRPWDRRCSDGRSPLLPDRRSSPAVRRAQASAGHSRCADNPPEAFPSPQRRGTAGRRRQDSLSGLPAVELRAKVPDEDVGFLVVVDAQNDRRTDLGNVLRELAEIVGVESPLFLHSRERPNDGR